MIDSTPLLPQLSLKPTIAELEHVIGERQRILVALSQYFGRQLKYSTNNSAPLPANKNKLLDLITAQKEAYQAFLQDFLDGAQPHHRRIVILDLDETLIYLHSPAKDQDAARYALLSGLPLTPLPAPEGIEFRGSTLCKRSHLDAFIQQLLGWQLDVAICSTGTFAYIQEILKACDIDPDLFVKIWHREHCARSSKSIDWALADGYQRGNILVVDDAPCYRSITHREIASFSQNDHVLFIKPFCGEPDDELLGILRRIAILKELDLVKQRKKELQEWKRWKEQANAYEASENIGVSPYNTESDFSRNQAYKRYPVPKPRPIDDD